MAEVAPNPNASTADPAGEDFSMSVPESWRTVAVVVPPATPAQRIALIEDSQRCLTNGWLSLVPVVGAFCVVPAVRQFLRLDGVRVEWNPAAHLWLRGLVLTCFGFWTNLLWWGLVVQWVVNEPHRHDAIDGMSLAYVMLFGGVPTVFGLAVAATRWPNAIGAFVLRYRWTLAILAFVGFMLLLQWLSLAEWRHSQSMPDSDGEWHPDSRPAFAFSWSKLICLVWLVAGLPTLSLPGVKSPWWWLVWLAGAAVLIPWATASHPDDFPSSMYPVGWSSREVGPFVMCAMSVIAGLAAAASVMFRRRWLALVLLLTALWLGWLGGR